MVSFGGRVEADVGLVWDVGLFEGCGEGDEGVSDCCDYSARVWWVVFLVCCIVCLG